MPPDFWGAEERSLSIARSEWPKGRYNSNSAGATFATRASRQGVHLAPAQDDFNASGTPGHSSGITVAGLTDTVASTRWRPQSPESNPEQAVDRERRGGPAAGEELAADDGG